MASSNAGAAERRREPRLKVRQLVGLRPADARRTFFAYTADVSKSGLFVETPHLRPVGTKLVLEAAAGSVTMEVVRIQSEGTRGMGLRRV